MSSRPPSRPVRPDRLRLERRVADAWQRGYRIGRRVEREVRDDIDVALREILGEDGGR